MLGHVSSHFSTSRSNSDPHIDAMMKSHAAMNEEELKQKAKIIDPSKPVSFSQQQQPTANNIRRPPSPTAPPKTTPSSVYKTSTIAKSAPVAQSIKPQPVQLLPSKSTNKPETPPLTPSVAKSPSPQTATTKQPSKPSPSEPATMATKRRAEESVEHHDTGRRRLSGDEPDITSEADYKEKLSLLYPRIDSVVCGTLCLFPPFI